MKDVNQLCYDERSALYAAMKKAGYAAVSPIVTHTRPELPVSSRPAARWHKPGLLAGTLRASAYKSGAAARMGSSKVPWAGWVEFGGSRPDGSSRQYIQGGRYFFPNAVAQAPTAVVQYTQAINELFGRTAIWTNSQASSGSVHD
jgi:hypothetical protein